VVLADLFAAGRWDGLGVLKLVGLLLCRALATVVLCLLLARVLLGLLLRVLLIGRVGHVVGGLDEISSIVCLSLECDSLTVEMGSDFVLCLEVCCRVLEN
jgi:hypothetical protein